MYSTIRQRELSAKSIAKNKTTGPKSSPTPPKGELRLRPLPEMAVGQERPDQHQWGRLPRPNGEWPRHKEDTFCSAVSLSCPLRPTPGFHFAQLLRAPRSCYVGCCPAHESWNKASKIFQIYSVEFCFLTHCAALAIKLSGLKLLGSWPETCTCLCSLRSFIRLNKYMTNDEAYRQSHEYDHSVE